MGLTLIEFLDEESKEIIYLHSVSQAITIMLKLIARLFPLRAIKLFLRFLASLASAIVIVSGYLFFISNNGRNAIDKSEDDDYENELTEESD